MTAYSGPPILYDTREQRPYSFDTPARKVKLEAGDYSVTGLSDLIALERKEKDFVPSLITDRERFFEAASRMTPLPFRALVAETTLADVYAHNYQSAATRESVLGSMISLMVDYRIPVILAGKRPFARWFAQHFLHEAAKRAMSYTGPPPIMPGQLATEPLAFAGLDELRDLVITEKGATPPTPLQMLGYRPHSLLLLTFDLGWLYEETKPNHDVAIRHLIGWLLDHKLPFFPASDSGTAKQFAELYRKEIELIEKGG